MTSRGPQSAYSSRDVSPESRHEPYDPFRDPIELGHMSRSFLDIRDAYDTRGQASSETPRLQSDRYFEATPTKGQYAQVQDGTVSPRQSLRSARDSTYTVNSLYRGKSSDPDTQALVASRAGELAQWHIYWTTPALVIFLFLAGFAAAVGHHLFYNHLNGQPAIDQLKMVRYGTALAFFVKSTFVGAVVMCNRQRIWYTFRRKAMTIKGIDGLFSATEDPSQFFLNWEMVRNGKLATFMAVCSWLIPLASVLSPASLTSELRITDMNATCSVANLNFAKETTHDFRDKTVAGLKSLNFYNTTDPLGKKPGYFDYYDQPSKTARRLAFSSVYMQKPQPRENASSIFCGDGWNCTYPITFMGPGYKCDDVQDPKAENAPFTLDQLAPTGNLTYLADVDQGNYGYQDPAIEGDELGVMKSEPNLWIGYAINTSQPYDDDSPHKAKWEYIHTPKMFKCVMQHTNYTFQMSYSPRQTANRTQRTFLRPVIATTVKWDTQDPTNWTASPPENYLRPQDDAGTPYKLAATYHSLGALLRQFLRGSIEKQNFLITHSDISETRLVNSRTSYPLVDLSAQIQAFFEDILITLLNEPTLVVAAPMDVECVKSRSIMAFVYYKEYLWIGYAAVIAVTFAFILVGAWSLYGNGVASDVLFSRILATTRNPTLDHLSVGACLGGDPFPKELAKTKLRFGVLIEDEEGAREGPLGRVEHCCFGTMGETKEIVKGGLYAGLKFRGEKGDRAEMEGLLG
ncbi:hypothetical protein PTTW11_08612 [Pyrenophora teres f. teres]|uniref:Uncharacterized protein n=1 Tax=Pyrenophora teres f. teres TaxID=97479 RepID=A0A6S6W8P1_9PLEO|nr:hypothetical protein PTNB29_07076 [Pyrenophora teres f. teres]CAE7200234.1 hypothetical protein PTTW11_08612 [Pyrenophora teres f. teres]